MSCLNFNQRFSTNGSEQTKQQENIRGRSLCNISAVTPHLLRTTLFDVISAQGSATCGSHWQGNNMGADPPTAQTEHHWRRTRMDHRGSLSYEELHFTRAWYDLYLLAKETEYSPLRPSSINEPAANRREVEWMNYNGSVLIMKDAQKGQIPCFYNMVAHVG